MKKHLLTLLILLMVIPAFARDFSYTYEGQTLMYTVLDEGANTVKTHDGEYGSPGNNVSGNLIIPSQVSDGIETYTVVELGKYAFNKCRMLGSVSIPYSVMSIDMDAFKDCTGLGKAEFSSIEQLCLMQFGSSASNPLYYAYHLYIDGEEITELVIPDTVSSVGSYAFENCGSVISVTIPDTVTSFGSYSFYGCTRLASIELPDKVTSIGSFAFKGCGALSSITIPDSVTSIGEGAFSHCVGLTKAEYSSVEHLCSIQFGSDTANPLCYAHHLYIDGKEVTDLVFPETVKSISNCALSGCSGLTSITIGNSVTKIGILAFSECTGLTSVTIGNRVRSIGKYAFYGCSGLTSVTIPDLIIKIGEYTFSHCRGLNSVTIGNSVATIDNCAFENCSNLTSVTIPNSVTSIGYNVFRGCTNLTSFSLADGIIPFEGRNISDSDDVEVKQMYVGRPLKSNILSINSLESLTFGNTVTEIPSYMWSDASKLVSLTLGNSLTYIGKEAFKGCTALEEVIVPPSVKTIDDSAFEADIALKSITMGHGVVALGENVFRGCPADNIYITALTPPKAFSNTFSSYSGILWLQDDASLEKYSNSKLCWGHFASKSLMTVPTEIAYEGEYNITGEKGDTFQLMASLIPSDVTLPQIFWRSTNPEIATVDQNGLVTLQKNASNLLISGNGAAHDDRCIIIAESLYSKGPMVRVGVNDTSFDGVDILFESDDNGNDIDFRAPIEIFNINGMRINATVDTLDAGLYILRQGKKARKIAVK